MTNLYILCTSFTILLGGVYILENEERFERSEKQMVIGGIHCVGTESELLECNHHSIGLHRCASYGTDYSDIIISCTGI